MLELDSAIKGAEILMQNLEKASQDEKNYSFDTCQLLERYSWEIYKMGNEIKHIKEYWG
jgi:hypothetical protein